MDSPDSIRLDRNNQRLGRKRSADAMDLMDGLANISAQASSRPQLTRRNAAFVGRNPRLAAGDSIPEVLIIGELDSLALESPSAASKWPTPVSQTAHQQVAMASASTLDAPAQKRQRSGWSPINSPSPALEAPTFEATPPCNSMVGELPITVAAPSSETRYTTASAMDIDGGEYSVSSSQSFDSTDPRPDTEPPTARAQPRTPLPNGRRAPPTVPSPVSMSKSQDARSASRPRTPLPNGRRTPSSVPSPVFMSNSRDALPAHRVHNMGGSSNDGSTGLNATSIEHRIGDKRGRPHFNAPGQCHNHLEDVEESKRVRHRKGNVAIVRPWDGFKLRKNPELDFLHNAKGKVDMQFKVTTPHGATRLRSAPLVMVTTPEGENLFPHSERIWPPVPTAASTDDNLEGEDQYFVSRGVQQKLNTGNKGFNKKTMEIKPRIKIATIGTQYVHGPGKSSPSTGRLPPLRPTSYILYEWDDTPDW